jgi:hypothetical protein
MTAGDLFLLGGLLFSALWHLSSWLFYFSFSNNQQTMEGFSATALKNINFGLSGVSFCAFGYLCV